MQELTLEKFEEVLQDKNLNVVMCSAVWCSACRAVTPVVEQVSQEVEGVQFYKADVDKVAEIAGKYGVSSIPAILFIKDGNLVEKHVGVLTKTPLKNKIQIHQ